MPPSPAAPSAGHRLGRVPRGRLIVWLEAATWLYVGLPVLLWVCTWLAPLWAAVLGAGLVAGTVTAWRNTRRLYAAASPADAGALPALPLAAVGLLAAVWGVYSGAGGYAYFNPDWHKHFAILRDLVERPWPVVYGIDGREAPLVYYLSYYLPAAVAGSIGGWEWACRTIQVWTSLGTVIAAAWFVILVGRRPLVAAVLFVLANGLDLVGHRLVAGGAFPGGTEHLDWWSGWPFLSFPGHMSQLAWAPQHSLAAWSVTALLAVQFEDGRTLDHAGLLAALAAFWSPFTAVGLAPFAVVQLVRLRGAGLPSIANASGVLLLAVNALYLAARPTPPPSAFLWETNRIQEDWARLALFHLLEWGVFALFAAEVRRAANPALRWLLWTALATLVLVPLYRLGIYNDWCMRAPIPALLLLWAGVARSALRPGPRTETRLLWLLLGLGAMGALHESARSWNRLAPTGPDLTTVSPIPHLDPELVHQYEGDPAAFFFRHLAAAATVLPLGPRPPDAPAPEETRPAPSPSPDAPAEPPPPSSPP